MHIRTASGGNPALFSRYRHWPFRCCSSPDPSLPNALRTPAPSPRRQVGRPIAHPVDKIEYARLLRGEGHSYSQISAKTSIPKASLLQEA
jgi:hypothetical protein